jgi:hypothetical protein
MTNTTNKLGLLSRTAISVAVSLCFASAAYAQSSDGSIFGRTTSKAQVTVESLDTGSKRNINAEADGNFAFSKLSPGRYKVTAGGVTREVNVAIGSGTEVKFTDMAVVTVAGSRTRNPIDVSSTESNTVLTQAEIQALPVPRSATAVALLAPGIVRGDADLGGGSLPSVGGASVAENGYYINGFDVTNIRNFIAYATLPFDAVDQQQIKTGGYGAEYGRSLGGVIAISTKRGTNTWKSGVAAYYSPRQLRGDGKNVLDKDPDLKGDYYIFSKDDERDEISLNAWTGGPIIKDKLFMYAIVEGQRLETNDFKKETSERRTSSVPNGMIKIDYLPNANHRFEYTGIDNKKNEKIYLYHSPTNYMTSNVGTPERSNIKSGGTVSIYKYTGYLTDNLTVSAQAGRVFDLTGKEGGERTLGKDCPEVYDNGVNYMGCWKEPFANGARDPKAKDDSDTRKSSRFDLEYTLGNHTLRAGYDGQKFLSAQAGGSTYSGGAYYRYLISASGAINGVANAITPGGVYVRKRTALQTSGEYEVKNTAWYLEDSFNVTKNILLYGGLRSESFDNKNSDGISFVKADNLLAPRFGASWNVFGNASLKVYGNAGRYYIPVASNTNIRATRLELSTQDFYTFSGMDPRTKAPLNLSAPIGISTGNAGAQLPNPGTVADTDLKPMSQDEYILGFQKLLTKGWSFGMKATQRKVNDGMDDYCNTTGIARWAKDNGYTKFDYHDLAQCVLMNPGNPLHLNVDVNNDGVLKSVVIPNSYLGLAKYERKYQAVEFSIDRPFDGTWGVAGSYTLAKSTGTAEGYVQSQLNQEDAGVTQDFDFGSFSDGSNGYLPNDRRHQFKAYGNYQLTENWRLGFNFVASSGRPKSCIGYVPETAPDYYGPVGTLTGGSGEYNSASSYYCLDDTGHTKLTQRGTFGRTPWTNSTDLSLAYLQKFGAQKLTLQMDIFNIFNQREVTEQNEQRDYSRADSRASGPIDPAKFVAGKLNPNYGQPTGFQARRSVRFTARYEF